MELSNRAKNTPESPIRKLFEYGRLAKEKGINIYHLNIGQPDLSPPLSAMDFLHNYKEPVIEYSHSQGEKVFLKSLVDYYKRLGHDDLLEDNFIATIGGSEAILWAIITVANPGDEVLVFEPFYTNYKSLALMAGVDLVAVTTKVEEGFHLPKKEEIAKKISAKTKAIIICNPNNPTGTLYTAKELNDLYDLCLEYNLYFLSDEVYREFVYNGDQAVSVLTIEKEREKDLAESRVIILDSFSKRYSLCGARIGLVCSRNKNIIQTMLRYGQARLSAVSIIMQMTAEIIKNDQSYLEKIVESFASRRKTLIEGLNNIPGVMFREPEGAFYVTVKLPVKDTEEFAQWLLTDFNDHNETVMLAPAKGFYLTEGLGKDEVRIAYVLNEADLKRAMEILSKAIDKWEERRG